MSKMTEMLIIWAIVIVLTTVIQVGAFLLRGLENPQFVQNLRDALFRQILEQDIAYFDKTPTGLLVSRLSEDVVLVLQTYTDKLNNSIQYLSQIVGAVVLSMSVSWRAH
jgi:ATP-binding cassette subfamily B (MDR/TAP) protein 10